MGTDSGWQAVPAYEDTGLVAATTYSYTVQARDTSSNQNTTAASAAASATTNMCARHDGTDTQSDDLCRVAGRDGHDVDLDDRDSGYGRK